MLKKTLLQLSVSVLFLQLPEPEMEVVLTSTLLSVSVKKLLQLLKVSSTELVRNYFFSLLRPCSGFSKD